MFVVRYGITAKGFAHSEKTMSPVQQTSTNVLSQLLEPVGQMMPVEFARALAALKAAPEVQARIDELAEKCTEGLLTEAERSEYDAYVDAIDVISILQAKARSVLARLANG
jgi:hypothetical protein